MGDPARDRVLSAFSTKACAVFRVLKRRPSARIGAGLAATSTQLPYSRTDAGDCVVEAFPGILITNDGNNLAGPILVDTHFSSLTPSGAEVGTYNIWNCVRRKTPSCSATDSYAVHDAHFGGSGGCNTSRKTKLSLDALSSGEAFGLQYDVTGDTDVRCTATLTIRSGGIQRGKWSMSLVSEGGATTISHLKPC
jgi:hypothetical protein